MSSSVIWMIQLNTQLAIPDDTKLGWNMTKDRASVQSDLKKTWVFDQHKPGKDEQSEAQSFVLEWKNPVLWYRPGTHWLRNRQPCWKGLGVIGDARLNMSCQCPLITNRTNDKLAYITYVCLFLVRLHLKHCI